MIKNFINKSTNRNGCSAKKYIRFDYELLNQISFVIRPDESFSSWVKDACRLKLSGMKLSQVALQTDKNAQSVKSGSERIEDLILDLSQKGMFNQQIADELSRLGVKQKNGKKWTRGTVGAVIKSLTSN